MDIEGALVAHLLADDELTALVGNNLFPLAIPEGEQAPAVVWQRVSSPRTLSLSGNSADSPRFQFSAYAHDLVLARRITQALNNALDFFVGVLGDKTKVQVIRADYRDSYEHETGLYRSDVDFFIYYTNKKE